MKPMLKVLIVDDSFLIRKIITSALHNHPDMKVIATAENGEDAIAAVQKHLIEIDVVILDIEMPVMDGITALLGIRKIDRRLPVLMFSSLTQRGAEATIRALTSGASDYVGKPGNLSNSEDAFRILEEELIPKVRALGQKRRAISARGLTKDSPRMIAKHEPFGHNPIVLAPILPPQGTVSAVCIGISTGGPTALASLFESWQQTLPVPLFIVQHMPPRFTEMLAKRLSQLGPTEVEEAFDGQEVKSGRAYLAPGGWHMALETQNGKTKIRINDLPPENSCRPSVDMLFRTAADIYKDRLLGVVMTGMGTDGLLGSEAIVSAGGRIIAQDEESSTVWGMPGAVANANLASKVISLELLPAEIWHHVNG